MRYNKIEWHAIGANAEIKSFSTNGKVQEHHVILHVAPQGDLFAEQFQRLCQAESQLLGSEVVNGASIVMKRYFVSDSANQGNTISEYLRGQQEIYSHSIIQQPPLDGSKVALWIYLVEGMEMDRENGMVVCRHNGYQHLWNMGMMSAEGDSFRQTETLLLDYEERLARFGANIADNCIRTWFYVRDVDTQYGGLVKARRENFLANGLSQDTHYIASTGIGGSPAETKALIQLGAYALTNFDASQQHYLYALSHLNRTIEYGVTFERGVVVDYGDRSHAYISGTASINNKGEVVHVGDIVRQTERMWENVEQLLAETSMNFDDVMQIIVYLRDTADYQVVNRMFEERFPDMPYVITLAPVCRPAWLIEMECIAVKESTHPEYRDF